MDILNFKLNTSLPATPYVSDTLKGGKTIAIKFPDGKYSAIFVQFSTDGTSWNSKQSISPTNNSTFNVDADKDSYLRVCVSQRPELASYKDYSGGGGGIVEEYDPTVPSWAKQPTKPTYTAAEVGAAPQSEMGDLSKLDESVSADNLVTAINKAAQQGGGGAEHEKVRIVVRTSVEGVNVSGLSIYVYYNDDTESPITVTTDNMGMCAFEVPTDYKYRVVFPDIEGCSSVPDVVHTAVLRERSIEVEYKAADAIKEILTVNVRKYVQGVATAWADRTVKITIGGNTSEYTTNSRGIVEVEIPVGTVYTASVDTVEDMYVHGNLSHTYTAEHTVRNIYFDYHDMGVGLFLVDKNGAEYTYDEWVASGKDGSDAVFIKFAEARLLADNGKGIFYIKIDDVSKHTYTPTKQWCNQNVLFNNIPGNGNSSSAQYYYDGRGATVAIKDEAVERGLFVAAADFCLGSGYDLDNGEHLEGFLWTIGQNRIMFNNVTPLNAMIALVRPDAQYNFSNVVSTSLWTSAQSNAVNAYYVNAGVSNNSKSYNYGVLVCYAP